MSAYDIILITLFGAAALVFAVETVKSGDPVRAVLCGVFIIAILWMVT